MIVNKYRFNIQTGDRFLNIPIEIKTDLLGRDDLLDKFEEETIEKVINPIEDFEVTRYAHKEYDNSVETSVNYQFNFFNHNIDVESTTSSNTDLWLSDYVFTNNPNFTGTCFTEAEIYYGANSFKRSFFKLDLYDTTESETQQIYLTLIIPTQQGKTRLSGTQPLTGSSGPIQGPDLPDVVPDLEPANEPRSRAVSYIIDESQRVYDRALSELEIYNNNQKSKDQTKHNIKNLAYNEQLKYELEESHKRALESRLNLPQGISADSTTDFGDPGPVDFGEEGEGISPIEPEGTEINQNPEGVGEAATPTLTVAPPNTDIKLPDFVLDYIGDKEGFFIYWLKNPNYVELDKLYMSAKFFNAKTGQFIRFMNQPQANLSNKFNFDKRTKFYYEISLDINNYEYIVNNTNTGQRVGQGTPIKWFEYVNPS